MVHPVAGVDVGFVFLVEFLRSVSVGQDHAVEPFAETIHGKLDVFGIAVFHFPVIPAQSREKAGNGEPHVGMEQPIQPNIEGMAEYFFQYPVPDVVLCEAVAVGDVEPFSLYSGS